MRSWTGPVLGVAIVVLMSSGCARSRPCPIIPMQLELARGERDQIKADVEQKQAEVRRSADQLEQARTRLQQMEEELAELKRVLEEQTDGDGEGKQ